MCVCVYMCALKKWMDIDWISFLHRPDIHQDSQGYKFGNKNIKTKKIRLYQRR